MLLSCVPWTHEYICDVPLERGLWVRGSARPEWSCPHECAGSRDETAESLHRIVERCPLLVHSHRARSFKGTLLSANHNACKAIFPSSNRLSHRAESPCHCTRTPVVTQRGLLRILMIRPWEQSPGLLTPFCLLLTCGRSAVGLEAPGQPTAPVVPKKPPHVKPGAASTRQAPQRPPALLSPCLSSGNPHAGSILLVYHFDCATHPGMDAALEEVGARLESGHLQLATRREKN